MTDVLKIAIERRAQLQDEVAKLDDFIRMAEALMSGTKDFQPEQAQAAAPEAAVPAEPIVRTAMRRAQDGDNAEADSPRPSIIRRSANAAG